MSPNKILSDYLDVLVRKIAKTSVFVPKAGLMTGKIGIAILLYNYSRYKNETEMSEYADNLIDLASHNIDLAEGKGINGGLCGIAWGIDYLIKQEFVQADENIFEEIDDVLFQEERGVLNFYNLGTVSEMGLYAWNRLKSCEFSVKNVWFQHIESCVHHFRDIVMQRYTCYNLPVLPCRILIRFFYICQILREII